MERCGSQRWRGHKNLRFAAKNVKKCQSSEKNCHFEKHLILIPEARYPGTRGEQLQTAKSFYHFIQLGKTLWQNFRLKISRNLVYPLTLTEINGLWDNSLQMKCEIPKKRQFSRSLTS